mgnify:CR=1 FL=1
MINSAYQKRINVLMERQPHGIKPAIYFDMDGTIADLYNVPDWLAKLTTSNVTPYYEALPIGNPEELKNALEALKMRGYHLGIVSWCAKGGSKEYNQATRRAKKAWLERYYPGIFEEIHIVKYGTPKHRAVNHSGILIDDNQEVRRKWGSRSIDATDFQNILKNLKILLDISTPNRNTIFTK